MFICNSSFASRSCLSRSSSIALLSFSRSESESEPKVLSSSSLPSRKSSPKGSVSSSSSPSEKKSEPNSSPSSDCSLTSSSSSSSSLETSGFSSETPFLCFFNGGLWDFAAFFGGGVGFDLVRLISGGVCDLAPFFLLRVRAGMATVFYDFWVVYCGEGLAELLCKKTGFKLRCLVGLFV